LRVKCCAYGRESPVHDMHVNASIKDYFCAIITVLKEKWRERRNKEKGGNIMNEKGKRNRASEKERGMGGRRFWG
jgi:hypothetical protein